MNDYHVDVAFSVHVSDAADADQARAIALEQVRASSANPDYISVQEANRTTREQQ